MEKCYPLGRFAQSKSVAARPIILALLLFLTTYHASALDYYWVNGSGEWGESVTVSFGGGSITHMAHWAKIAVPLVPQDYHTIVPGSSDDVKFDGHNGGAVTIGNNTIAKCHNFNCSGAASAFTLSGGSAERLEIYGNTVLFAGMTIQIEVRFEAILGGGGTITSSGVHFGGTVYFEGDGSAGGWMLNDALGVNGTIYHTAGHLDTDGNAVTVGSGFYGNYQGDNTPELSLGASTVTINGDHGFFSYRTFALFKN